MHFQLPNELENWRNQLRAFVQRELNPLDAAIETSGVIPDHALLELAKLGMFGTSTPQRYGGLGLSMLGSCISIEELAKAHSAFYYRCGLNVHLGSKAIELDGSEELRMRWLPEIASGATVTAFALTEPGAGSDAASIKTTAVRDGNCYVLNGLKTFITNAAEAGVFTVFARTDAHTAGGRGISAFVVDRGAPGLRIGRKIEMLAGSGTSHCEVFLENCRVPATHLIGAEGRGFATAMKCLDVGRLHWGAYCVGAAQRLLDLAVRRTSERVQFGRPLRDNQGIEWRLADMAAAVHAARLVAYEAAWRYDNDASTRTPYAAMSKLVGADMAFNVADQVMQMFGGLGYSKDLPIERIWREVRVVKILDGTSEMMRKIVARHLF